MEGFKGKLPGTWNTFSQFVEVFNGSNIGGEGIVGQRTITTLQVNIFV